jgi:ribosome-associated protein
VDCGAAVAHIMQPAIRQYYHLEEIWGDKPVRLKFGAPKPAMPSEPVDAPARTAAKHGTPAKKTGARTAHRGAAPAAKKATAKQATAKKSTAHTATAKKGQAQHGAKPAPRKSAAAKGSARPAAKKAPAKKAPAKKTTTRR